jgi:hypothetical protein
LTACPYAFAVDEAGAVVGGWVVGGCVVGG